MLLRMQINAVLTQEVNLPWLAYPRSAELTSIPKSIQ